MREKQWQHFTISSINLWCGKLAISKWIFAEEKRDTSDEKIRLDSWNEKSIHQPNWKRMNIERETYENHLNTDHNGKLLKNLHLHLLLVEQGCHLNVSEKGKEQVYFSHPTSKNRNINLYYTVYIWSKSIPCLHPSTQRRQKKRRQNSQARAKKKLWNIKLIY